MADKSLKSKAIDIKGKKYVLVSDRILYFNESYNNGYIKTSIVSDTDADRVVIRAIVVPDSDNTKRRFVAHSQALWGDGYINKTSAIENCETSAVGRALALMGIGVIDSVASVDEINKAEAQSKMTMPDSFVKQIGELLDSKGITDPKDKQTIVKELSGGEPLNTSGLARLKKEIESAEPDTLREIVMGAL